MMLPRPLPYIFGQNIAEPMSRLSRYPRTRRCDPSTSATFNYESDAIVPQGLPASFAAGSTSVLTRVYGALSLRYAGFIGVINVEAAMQPLLALGVRDARNAMDIQEIKAGARYSSAFNEMIRNLESFIDITGPTRALDVTMKAPGLPTVSVNDNTGRRVGLHVDSWDRAKAPNRALARNRINMNFGSGPRHFLLVNAALDDAAKLLNLEFESYDRVARLVREILEQAPELEIIRIQVNPGEGYIAPTDNIIHDATTLDMHRVDISLSILGQLAFRKDSVVNILLPSEGADNSSLDPRWLEADRSGSQTETQTFGFRQL